MQRVCCWMHVSFSECVRTFKMDMWWNEIKLMGRNYSNNSNVDWQLFLCPANERTNGRMNGGYSILSSLLPHISFCGHLYYFANPFELFFFSPPPPPPPSSLFFCLLFIVLLLCARLYRRFYLWLTDIGIVFDSFHFNYSGIVCCNIFRTNWVTDWVPGWLAVCY